eukprot:CAMPEP_0172482840 /NCGR_PEP_ID=MMETSP1066-20121228/9480_1 /TAXON_ID=671091 /ORGANISM="Coscinodiscus wailesii, Strain CCMP2513" /LENGTH=93 /DNA_ID=CAMNT_0013246289 /DNA_START=249 /DNA_END=530 /DNA_ORIENTATION=-
MSIDLAKSKELLPFLATAPYENDENEITDCDSSCCSSKEQSTSPTTTESTTTDNDDGGGNFVGSSNSDTPSPLLYTFLITLDQISDSLCHPTY